MAVGKLRPPFVDDVAHYTKMLAGHARMELIEVREDERAERRRDRQGAFARSGLAVGALAVDHDHRSALARTAGRGQQTAAQLYFVDATGKLD